MLGKAVKEILLLFLSRDGIKSRWLQN